MSLGARPYGWTDNYLEALITSHNRHAWNKWDLLKLLSVCFVVAFWPLALVFLGGFPVRQGLVLGLLMALLVFSIGEGVRSKPVRLIPYWVRVSPNWFQILADFRLIGSPEEWRSILQSVESSPDYSPLRDGILFTVVQQSEDFEHTLIFWNQHQAFGSQFEFEENMTPIQFERQGPEGGHLPARLFMKPYTHERDVAGYSLGIAVRDWWWEQVKASCTAPLAVDTANLTGTVELTLATLPLEEFDIYRDPTCRWTHKYITKVEPHIRKHRDERRERFGWKDKMFDFEPGIGTRQPESIEHKYFRLEHREV